MADEKTTFELDLDNKEFLKKALESKEAILALGESKNLSGLLQGLMAIGPIVGGLGVAFFAFKTIMEEVFEGERIKQVNVQFEQLSKNAGVAGEALKSGLERSSAGLIDNTDLLKIANKALVEMGSNAARLPEIMETARKVTAVFGGDLKTNFENLNTAISMGNQRMLKHMGIKIDVARAEADYGKSIGKTNDQLTQQDKQTAILEATLKKAQTRFNGVNTDLTTNLNLWTQLKVTIKDVTEVIAIAFEKTFGGRLKQVFAGLSTMAQNFKNDLTASTGTGLEQMNAKMQVLTLELNKMRLMRESLGDKPGFFQKLLFGTKAAEGYDKAIEDTKRKIHELNEEIMKETQKGKAEQKTKTPEKDVELEREIHDKKIKNETAFNAELLKIKKSRLDSDMEGAETALEVERIHTEQKLLLAQEYDSKIAEIREKQRQNVLDEKQADDLIYELELEKNNKIEQADDELWSKKEAALNRHVEHAKTASEGFAAAFTAGSAKAAHEVGNFGHMGTRAFQSVGNNAKKAFIDMGSGAKSGGEAMKGFFFSVLADMAEQEGEFMLLSGIFPPNPAALAGGAALLALSGFLRSQGGGAGGGSGGGGGVGADIGSAGGIGGLNTTQAAQQADKKTLSVNIHGNYFDTEQTRTRLMEMMRESSDATDFNLVKVGQ